MKPRLAWWPWALAVLATAWAISSLFPRQESGWHFHEFGRLPVLLNGRVQPLDSVAANALMQLRNKRTVRREDGSAMGPAEWLAETMFHPSRADDLKAFRMDHPEVLSLLRLPDDEKHFSYRQLQPHLEEIEKQARRAGAKEPAQRTTFEQQTLKLYQALILYQRLQNSIKPDSLHDPAAALAAYEEAIGPGVAAVRARDAGEAYNEEDFNRLLFYLRQFETVSRMAYPLVIPPKDPVRQPDAWDNMGNALLEAARQGAVPAAAHTYATLASAFHAGDTNLFNRTLDEYQRRLGAELPGPVGKATSETRFNAFMPFYRAMVIDIIAFLFVCAYWFRMSENLRRAAVWLTVVAVGLQTLGLLYRMVLEGRPPVTNLYSSAIFIGWGSAFLGLILERFHRTGIGVATASGVSFITLVIAHNLAVGGDTMEMMRAVLDSNFWLATHVVTVTLGYSAMFVAGFLGILYIGRGLLTRSLTEAGARALGRLIYGVTCFATLFSFVGTILGGIWADQSWGRFWGWDPKENGALIIVLWCAVMLHARWGGLVRDRGLAAMAVFGNIVTSFSWFGVNMLGVGLHSYGFMDAAFRWLSLFVASQLAIILLAAIPLAYWASFRSRPARSSRAKPARA